MTKDAKPLLCIAEEVAVALNRHSRNRQRSKAVPPRFFSGPLSYKFHLQVGQCGEGRS